MELLRLPVEQERSAEILGHGPDAAPKVVEILRRLGGRLMILTIVEHAEGRVDRLSLEALVLARRLAAGGVGPVHAVLIGEGARAAAAGLAGQGVAVAHVAEDPRLAEFAPAAWAATVAAGVRRIAAATVVLAPGSDRATEVLAHVAARTGLPMAANVVDVPGGCRRRRTASVHPPALGGQPARGRGARRAGQADLGGRARVRAGSSATVRPRPRSRRSRRR